MTRWLPLSLTAFAIFALDQLSKYWVVERLDLKNVRYMEVFDPFLNFTMAWNTGVNFGLGALGSGSARYILIVIALLICAALLYWVRHRQSLIVLMSAGMVIGGAIGNVIDRIRYGAVADFLNMSCCGIHNPFAFNVADIAIFAGAAGVIFFFDKTG